MRTTSDALEHANGELRRVLDERQVFVALIENSSDFVGIADAKGNPTYLNPAGRRMVGLSADFPIRQTQVTDYYPADQRAFASDVIIKTAREHGHWEGETSFRHWQTDRLIPVSDAHFLIRKEDTGEVLGMGTVTRDISEIKRVREELEAVARASTSVSEAVAGLPESSMLAVLYTIALKAQSLTSAEFAAVGLGSNPDRPFDAFAFAGIGDEQAMKMGPYPRPLGLLGLVSRGRAIRLANLRDHPEHWGFPAHHPVMTSFIGVPIHHKGRTLGSLYVANKRGALEFTPQDQEVAEMLAESVGVAIETARLYSAEGVAHAWLESVVDQMPEGVVLMDANGHVLVENRYAHSLAAAESSPRFDRFGNRVTLDLRWLSGELLQPDDVPIVKALLDKKSTHEHELMARRADGRLVHLLVSAAVIRSATGDLTGATMILQDVSPLKELERVREEWASIVAHDLQQPIHTILLRSDLLLLGHLSDVQHENVRQVRIAVQFLSRMVNDLLDASRLDTNRMQITLNRVDIGELVRDIVERVPNAQPRTRIRTPAGYRLFVQGDAQRLEQIVTNLVSNALKFGEPDTEIQVDVRVNDERVEVSVTNKGPGIPPDDLPIVFDRYARSRAIGISRTKGLGLGLYIAKGLVDAHGGRIWAESVPNETTIFYFAIPLDGPPVATAPSSAVAEAVGELL
jgi:PAS domain S-box-containing protein